MESREGDWKDLTYHCVAEAPSPESRERFLEGLAGALGVSLPAGGRDASVMRVEVRYRAWHQETRYLMLGVPGEPIEIGIRDMGSTVELFSFTMNFAADEAGALAALAATLRATEWAPPPREEAKVVPVSSRLSTSDSAQGAKGGELSQNGKRLRSTLRRMGEVAVPVSPGGIDEIDANLLAAEMGKLPWGGRVGLVRLIADWQGPTIDRALLDFLREAQTRASRKPNTCEHEALVWVVGALTGADPNTLRSDPATLERLLKSCL